MTVETILQNWVLTDFVYPFLLAFFIVFAVLEKTKILGGDEKRQLNAFVAFVIGLIFVGAVYPKMVVGNMILFLTVSLVVVFVFMLLWGFITGGEVKVTGNKVKVAAGVLVFIAVAIAVLWATDSLGIFIKIWDFLFHQSWSEEFWTNALFVLVIIGALAAMIRTTAKKP
jgi:hypothetical protein